MSAGEGGEEFTTSAELEVVVTDRSLRRARRDIEDGLGDVEVGVDAGPGAMLGGGGAGDVGDIADDVSDLVDLAEVRNDLLRDILEAVDEDFVGGEGGAGFRPPRGRGGGGLGGAGAIGIFGLGALIGALRNFEWPDLPQFDVPDSIPVNAPPFIPLQLPDFDLPNLPGGSPTPTPTPTPGPGPAPGSAPGRIPAPGGTPAPTPSPAPGIGPLPTPGGTGGGAGAPGGSPAVPPFDRPAGGGSPRPNRTPTGGGDVTLPDLPRIPVPTPEQAIGAVAGAAGIGALARGGAPAAGGGVGAGIPLPNLPALTLPQAESSGLLEGLGLTGGRGGGTPRRATLDPLGALSPGTPAGIVAGGNRGGTQTEASVSNDITVNVDFSETLRELSTRLREVEREVEQIASGGGGGSGGAGGAAGFKDI